MADVDTRLELYRDLSKADAVEKLAEITQEYNDRFGALPAEVENLFYAIRIKNLAAQAGIESVSTQEGQIIIRRFTGMPFDRQKLELVLSDEIHVGRTRIMLSYKKIGKEWKKVLEDILRGVI